MTHLKETVVHLDLDGIKTEDTQAAIDLLNMLGDGTRFETNQVVCDDPNCPVNTGAPEGSCDDPNCPEFSNGEPFVSQIGLEAEYGIEEDDYSEGDEDADLLFEKPAEDESIETTIARFLKDDGYSFDDESNLKESVENIASSLGLKVESIDYNKIGKIIAEGRFSTEDDGNEYLDSYEYIFQTLINGNLRDYREQLAGMGKSEIREYINWANDMGIPQKDLKLEYLVHEAIDSDKTSNNFPAKHCKKDLRASHATRRIKTINSKGSEVEGSRKYKTPNKIQSITETAAKLFHKEPEKMHNAIMRTFSRKLIAEGVSPKRAEQLLESILK